MLQGDSLLVADAYFLADLMRLTGAKRRTIQYWADHGVIKAEKGTEGAGTGTSRRFSRNEAFIACLVAVFAEKHMAVDVLVDVAAAVRKRIEGEDLDSFFKQISQSITYMILTSRLPGVWKADFFSIGSPEFAPPFKEFMGMLGPHLGALHTNRAKAITFIVSVSACLFDFFEGRAPITKVEDHVLARL